MARRLGRSLPLSLPRITMRSRLPKELPTTLATQLGPLSVGYLSEEESARLEAMGYFSHLKRTVDVLDSLPLEQKWQTFWHEVLHVALWDSGANNVLESRAQELVCDAVGTFLTQMMLAGQLRVVVSKDLEPSSTNDSEN